MNNRGFLERFVVQLLILVGEPVEVEDRISFPISPEEERGASYMYEGVGAAAVG
jgi:hypothetical protein